MSRPPDRGADLRDGFRLHGRRVRPRLNRVVETDGSTRQLEPKIMEVLVRLAAADGEVVSRESLLDDVWEDTFVTDDVLTRSITELRKTFDDDARDPEVIETIRTVGYRLIAEVRPLREPDPGAEDRGHPSRARAPDPSSRNANPERQPGAAPTPDPDRRGTPGELPGSPGLRTLVGVASLLLLLLAALWGGGYLRAGPEPGVDGSAVVPITSSPGGEHDPAVSPDGSRVAFAWDGGVEGDLDLYVQAVGAASPFRLTRHPGSEHAPAWSIDGERIAFARRTAEDCRIFVIGADGGTAEEIARCGDRDYLAFAWSPDERWLVVSTPESPGGGLALRMVPVGTDAGDREARLLTSPPSGHLGDHSPAFSPGGDSISFVRSLTGKVDDLWLVPVDGDRPRRLTRDNSDIVGQDWLGDAIVFGSSRRGTYNLWTLAVPGGEARWAAGGGYKLKHPSAARDGSAVAYENWDYDINVWSIDPTGAPAPAVDPEGGVFDADDASATSPGGVDHPPGGRRLVASTQWDFEARLSPSGERLAFVSTRSGSYEIWLADSGDEPVRLTRFEGPLLRSPAWSPDGDEIVFTAYPGGRGDLYAVDLSGGRPRRITGSRHDEIAPRWSRDGRSIHFGSRRSGSWQIWRVAAAGGDPVPATREGGHTAHEWRDGVLLVNKVDAPGLWAVWPDGREDLVYEGLRPAAGLSWDVVDDRVYFSRRAEAGPDVVTMLGLAPLPDGGTTSSPVARVSAVSDGARAGPAIEVVEGPVDVATVAGFSDKGLSVSRDGRILYARTDRSEGDVMLLRGLRR